MPPPVQAVERALALLEAFAAENQSLSIDTVAHTAKLPRSTTYRLVHTLLEAGHLQQDGPKFRLAHGVLGLGYGRLRSAGFARTAQPVLDDLAYNTGETVILATSDQSSTVGSTTSDTITISAVSRNGGALNVVTSIGESFSPSISVVAAVLRPTPSRDIKVGFHGIGRKVLALALPVTNLHGDPLGAVAIVVPEGRMSRAETLDRFETPLRRSARQLGWVPI